MDGVLYDFVESVDRRLKASPEKWPLAAHWRMNPEFDQWLCGNVIHVFGFGKAVSGGLGGYGQLVEAGYRVEILSRPWPTCFEECAVSTAEWIRTHVVPYPHSINFVRPGEYKSDFVFDVIIEDQIRNAIEVAATNRFVVVLDQPWNRPDDPLWANLPDTQKDYVLRAQNWDEAVEMVHLCYDRKEMLLGVWDGDGDDDEVEIGVR